MVKPLADSGSHALGCLISKDHYLGGLSFNIFTHLYDSLVAPVLNYGGGIWGTTQFNQLHVIQNRACKFFLGVDTSTSNDASRGDMGWMPQSHRQYTEVARLYHRVETTSN